MRYRYRAQPTNQKGAPSLPGTGTRPFRKDPFWYSRHKPPRGDNFGPIISEASDRDVEYILVRDVELRARDPRALELDFAQDLVFELDLGPNIPAHFRAALLEPGSRNSLCGIIIFPPG